MERFVSVIIPNRNGGRTLGACLAAAFAVHHRPVEVIVVDDASTDDSVEVVRRYPCRLIRLARHGGAARARNAGAAEARGEVLFFTDADCLLQPDTLTRACRVLAAAGPRAAVGGTYTRLPHDRSFFSAFQSVFIRDAETKRAGSPDYLATHALAIDAEAFRESGGFPETFLPILEDVAFSHRLKRAGYRLVLDAAIEVQHIFNFTLGRSLANAYTKAHYWTMYSLANRDWLADSGTASHELKLNVAAWLLCLLLVLAALASGEPRLLALALPVQAGNLWLSRRLLAAFRAAKNRRFTFAAGLYYLLLYPLAVGAGALTGIARYPAWAGRHAVKKWGRSEFPAACFRWNFRRRKFTPTPFFNYSPFRHLPSVFWKRRPIQLTFFVTRRCNARCPFCFYLESVAPSPAAAPELTLDEIERVSRSLGSLLWLAFSGGEPYLRRDLPAISRIFYQHNRPAIMLYPSNGLLPERIREQTEQILRDCPRSVIAVKLSLDGVGEAHDRLRGTPGGFARVIETYERLVPLLARHSNFELGVNTVFCRANQDRMDAVADFVARLKHIRTHTVSLVRGDLADASHKQVDLGKYERIVGRLAQALRDGTAPVYRFAGGRLKAAQDIVQRRLILRTAREQRQAIPCHAGRLNLVLSESGEVFPCESRTRSFGNVRDHGYDLDAVLRTAAARETVRSINRGECHCTHECYFITNILFNPRLYPTLAREYLVLPRPAPRHAPRETGETARGVPTARTGS
jgi:GT2 family glycosyltransferase/MoaA/NifB/PqqE/SkfB family radical SAM enzyme